MKTCAIVILNFNGESMLRQFLPSVIEYSQYDVWVIDNASKDNSLNVLINEFPSVQVIELQENFGYAGGYNWGLEKLKNQYEFYILLNSDVEVSADWDQVLINSFQKDEKLAAVQPKILSYQNAPLFDYAGAGGGYLDSFYYPYCRGRIWDEIEPDEGQYDDFVYVDWASGACLAIKADLFHQTGGFDAHFFAHMEEIDLCVRMRQKGYNIGYNGRSAVFHLGGATLSRSSPHKLFLNIKNSLSMIYKAETKLGFGQIFLVKWITEWFAAIGYLIKGEKDLAFAIFKGYIEFWKTRGLYKKVVPNKKFRRLGPSNWIYWDFIVMGKKYFRKL